MECNIYATYPGIYATYQKTCNINMRLKNILIKELFNRKYRNRIKRSKKGKGSFKRLKKIKVEEWKKGRE